MRRSALIIGLVATASTARADVRALIAADSFVSRSADNTEAADVAWSVHGEWREADRSVRLDWVARESMIGGAARRELHELAYVERGVRGLELTVGRFRVPGGFWLIADGGQIAMKRADWHVGVFGGSRAFTNGRAETLLTRSPHPLPLVGATASYRGDMQATLSYAYTADRVVLYRGAGMSSTTRVPEQLLDAEWVAPLGARGMLIVGGNAGSRYLVTYPTSATQLTADPVFADAWLRSQAAYAMFDQKLGDWRVGVTAAALRTKLGQVDGAATDATGVGEAAKPAAYDGSFLDGTARLNGQLGAWRVDARYRLRVRDDRGHTQRAELSATWRHGDYELAARGGIDVHDDDARAPGFASHTTLLYRASAGRRTTRTELAIGAAATAALGDELASPGDDVGDRAPYTLEARSYGFAHAFATHAGWFGGVDSELDLHGNGVRALVQIGYAR